MPRDPSRKTAKRKPPRPKLDDDLIELASALAQYEIDEGCAGWLKMPWRNGWNAAQFALDIARQNSRSQTREFWLQDQIHRFHDGWFGADQRQESYWHIQEFLEVASEHWPMLRAAYRCAQVKFTLNGSGDGSIFNAILMQPLLALEWHPATSATTPEYIASAASTKNWARQLEQRAEFMENARCCDALGIESSTQNDANDWLRSAFRIAWRRRLYAVAYALPPAVVIGNR